MAEAAKILVVDDNPEHTKAAALVLRKEGYQVIEANSGVESLTLVKEHRPDVILLDVVMPDLDGFEICQRVKADPELSDVYVMMFSGTKKESIEQAKGLEIGADGYITRPISNRELLARVESILRIKAAEEETARYAAELERSNQELSHFAYILSHDLKEPLRMVQSFLGLLKMRYEEQLDETANEFIDFAVDGAERMQAMIESLLVYSRVETRGKPFQMTNLDNVFSGAVANLGLLIEESDALIMNDPLPNVMADAAQITQVFQNLISNAIKFRKEAISPEVKVSASKQRDGWIISVEDNGIGIDLAQQERIFNMFQRLHSRDDFPGMGAGLAICKRIVERHGGEIWVESNLGAGAKFCFRIPTEKN